MNQPTSSVPGDAEGRIELKIPASAQWVRVARLTVAGVASRLHFGIDAIEDIKLAVAEAINNAIQHAPTAPGREAIVTITFEIDENGLWISVADEGRVHGGLRGSLENSEATGNGNNEELPEGGLGLLLIRSLMDEVSHESGAHSDTTIKMLKRLPVRVQRSA
ncbi:MAG TPA: ATP-binding protein [Abditibacterium sp.]|jgi:serine/threonine-protein kinase RsbW